MRWIGLLIGLGAFGGITGGAFMASAKGWGLPGALDQPVSIRQGSTTRRHSGPMFLYFGGRRHYGGGFHGGK